MNKLLEDAKAAGFYIDAEGKIFSASTLNYVNEELAKFAELQQPQWISLKDRLPAASM